MRLSFILFVLTFHRLPVSADHWPEWRGPRGDGISTATDLPTHWSRTSGVHWKIDLPEPGNSTPVVWEDRIFLTQPRSPGERSLMCCDRTTGKLLWEYRVPWTAPESTHGTNPLCSSSPAVDGRHVVVWFGSAGLHCCDPDGNLIWKTDTGRQQHIWGYGTSPVIRGDYCFLNFGPGENAAVTAFHMRDGSVAWKQDEPLRRDGTAEAPFQNADYSGSWSTPLVATLGGREQLIVSLPFVVRSFDPYNGNELWHCEGTNALCYTSPVPFQDNIVAMGGYNGMAIAVPATGTGNVTAQRLWRLPKTPQRIGSAVYSDGHFYIHNSPGIAQCIDAASGMTVWQQRLNGPADNATNWSSLLLANGLCYSINQGGDCFVFRASPEFELIAVNSLEEVSNSSVVPAAGRLLIRTHKSLWSIDGTR
jgi:outer membrane protein assembly factor BamB